MSASTYVRAMTGRNVEEGTFSTPMDMRVREAIEAAFDSGGVTKNDFPSGTQFWMAAIAKSQGDAASPCAAGRQAEKRLR